MSYLIKFKEKDIGIGDKVKVIHKVVEQGKDRRQVFAGTIIKFNGSSDNTTVTVRRLGVNQIGIEKIFPLKDPFLEEILVTKSGHKGVRRSKLYYLRNKSKKETEKIFSRYKKKS